MKAARFHQHGRPEVLRYEEAPEPKPEPGEILVRVKACALNHLDIWIRQGSPAVQMAKAAGARVITTVGSDDKVAKASGLGADVVLNHTRESIADGVKRATGGRGVDVVIEHIGPATWEQSLRSLAKAGRLVTCGATSGPEVRIDLRYLYMRQTTVMGSFMGTRHELLAVAKWLGAGRIRAVIDSVLPLQDVRAAHEQMLERKLFGKIVLTP